jgi:hypothetical protein
MQAAMSASRAPTVQESNGRFAVAIAPGVVLRWWFEQHDRHVRCFVKVDAAALKDYTLVDIDETSSAFRCINERDRRSGY